MSLLQRLRTRRPRGRGFASFDGLTSLLGVAALGVATLSGVFFAPTAEPSDDAAFLPGGVIYFETSDSFDPSEYPGLRAVRVQCQGAGGAGGGANIDDSAGGGGGGGGYAEAFLTVGSAGDVTSTVTVTVGSGGTGVTGGSGNAGGDSSFGSFCVGNGGFGGAISDATSNAIRAVGGAGGGGTGDMVVTGDDGGAMSVHGAETNQNARGGYGGGSFLAGQRKNVDNDTAHGRTGYDYGGGGSGGSTGDGTNDRVGGAGGDGIVIVELLY